VKKIIFAAALIAALIPFAVAQDSATASASMDRKIDVRVPVLGHSSAGRHEPNGPKYCQPCLFYGGDLDSNDSDANGLANENDLIVNGAAVYTPFIVPVNKTWTVTGLFTNNQMDTGVLDPATSPYEVRNGIPAAGGTGGNLICHGTVAATSVPTGRNAFGRNEYTVAVKVNNCSLKGGPNKGGRKYWVSVVPTCTNTSDGNCAARSFESNTEDTAWSLNHHFGLREPANDSFFNSAFFGVTFAPTTEFQASIWFSAGVSGTSN
jgi:hypothetical protein